MKGPNEAIDELINKYLNNTLTDSEQADLDQWIAASPANKTLFEQLTNETWVNNQLQQMYAYDEARGWEKIRGRLVQMHQEHPQRAAHGKWRRMYTRMTVAACIALAAAIGSYYWFSTKPAGGEETIAQETITQDIPAPATNRATITLADQTVIFLDSSHNGELAWQGNAKLVKLDNGRIAYEAQSGARPATITYNTLSNPRGSRVIDMKLADGSLVWLNAGSSVTFPVSFSGKERKVSVTGEAYFEIAPDKTRPFLVSFASGNRKGTVEVLGTHFNINAYDDESSSRITLLEGAVKVTTGTDAITLRPGQQAAVAGNLEVINNANLEEVMAWKNGKFFFHKADVHTTMRQIARWYDVEVMYEGNIEGFFNGTISRDENVSATLKKLQLTGEVQFEIKDKKIIVKP